MVSVEAAGDGSGLPHDTMWGMVQISCLSLVHPFFRYFAGANFFARLPCPPPTPSFPCVQLAHEDTRIVSLTVTEKGYCQDVNGDLDRVSAMIERYLLL